MYRHGSHRLRASATTCKTNQAQKTKKVQNHDTFTVRDWFSRAKQTHKDDDRRDDAPFYAARVALYAWIVALDEVSIRHFSGAADKLHLHARRG